MNLGSTCLRSAVIAKVAEGLKGRCVFSSLFASELYWVPSQLMKPSPPQKNIRVPIPMVCKYGSFINGEISPEPAKFTLWQLGNRLPMYVLSSLSDVLQAAL